MPGNARIDLRRTWLLLGFAVAVAALYSRALACGFVDFDDDLYVTANERVQEGLNAGTFAWVWTAQVGVQWYPLTLLSHLADVTLFGLDPAGHHATSVVLHAVNSVLMFLVLRGLTREEWLSAVVAVVFAVHPLRVESVVWISERKDVLSGLFWMLGLWAWSAYARAPGWRWYLAALGLFALGLMSKPMVVTFPCVLLLLDAWPLGRFAGDRSGRVRRAAVLAIEKLPFFILAIAAGLTTILTQSAGGAVASVGSTPLSVRALNAIGAYGMYVWQSFVPVGLAIPYPMPQGGALWARAVAGGVVIAIWWIVGWRQRFSRPYVLVGGLWFFGVLAPVIGIVQVGAQSHADRYTYVPQIGLLIVVVWTVRDAVRRRPEVRRAVMGIAAAACAVFAVLTWVQIGYWRSSETLFARALSVTSSNSRAEVGYGRALLNSGRAAESIPHFEASIRLEPGLVHPRHNLALARAALGDSAGALNAANEGLELFPDHPGLLSVAGTAALNEHREEEAAAHLGRLVEIEALDPEAWVNLGIAQGQLGAVREAVDSFERALALDPEHVEAHYNLGVLYVRAGDRRRGEELIRRALELNPEHTLAAEALRTP